MPRISVIVPCFNLGAYLAEAVDSVLAQTVQDFEILVIDDGSTERETVAVLDGFSRPRTRLLRTENRGLARARNLGLAEAKGEFLCALDADDRLDPRYFEKALAAFAADPGLTFVSAWVQMFGLENTLWKHARCDLPTLLQEDTVMTAALVRTQAVRDAGGWDPEMGAPGDEDWDLWLSLVERGRRGTILPEVLFHYRRRPGSMGEACVRTPVHLKLLRYIAAKHRESYAAHLDGLLETKAGLLREAEGRIAERSARLETWLEPTARLKAAELQRLRDMLAAEEQREALEARAAAAEHRVAELLDSKSWKVTAPLRAALDLWLARGKK